MKKYILIFCTSLLLSSCATIIRGAGNECQRTPSPQREIRTGVCLLDLCFPVIGLVFLVIDASNGALYKPYDCK